MTLTYKQLEEYLDLFIAESHADYRWWLEVDGQHKGGIGADEDYFKQRIQALEEIREVIRDYKELAE